MSKVILKLGNDISTDAIYPGRFMATVLPSETPQYAFCDYPEFNARVVKNDIPENSCIVAGNNFGCGSSREQAASALKGHGLSIIARGFARIFLQNAINLGLSCIISPDIEASEGDIIEITGDKVLNTTRSKEYRVVPLPKARQSIIDAGGLIPYTRKRLLQKAGKS
ncbi:MAG: 3-isopropylmalate dehydratase small subunit [Ignavibacteria bacterium]|jgi:3-isopropylmalate dehydratase small subunit